MAVSSDRLWLPTAYYSPAGALWNGNRAKFSQLRLEKEIPTQKQAEEEKEGDRRHTRTRTRVSGGGGDTKIDSLGNGEQWRVYSLPVCVQLTLDWQKQLRLSLSWSVAGRFDKRGHLQEKVGVYVKKRLTLPAAAGQHSPLLLFTGHIRRWASSVRR